MKKSEAKAKLQAGEIQIHFDDKSKLELLNLFFNNPIGSVGSFDFYTKDDCENHPFKNLQIIKISEITEDEEEVLSLVVYEYWSESSNCWEPFNNIKKARKIKPDFTKEIDALNLKAKENGLKCVVTFEKL